MRDLDGRFEQRQLLVVAERGRLAGRAADDQALSTGAEQGGDPRTLARDGLVGLGYTPAEAEQLLADADSELPEELIAEALKRAGEARSAA